MTTLWNAGSHAVQFYENEAFIHHSIAEFFTQGANPSDSRILVSRSRTFTAVAGQLFADRIQFIDPEAVLPQIMDGENLCQDRAERLFNDVLLQARPGQARGTVRLYGEIVDILCQRGHHAAAFQFEGLASLLLNMEPRLSILCGYALERFKDDTNAAKFRAVCQKHTHVIPADRFGTQERTIYVIDDNATLRRAIGPKALLDAVARAFFRRPVKVDFWRHRSRQADHWNGSIP